MLIAVVASLLVAVIAKAGRRGRAHLLAGRRVQEFGWYVLVQVACVGLIALPFYEARATADGVSALVESISQPSVPGGGTDQAMAALEGAGFDRTVAFVDQFADDDRAATMRLYRREIEDGVVGEIPWYQRWYVQVVEGGRMADNMEAIAAAQEYRILPLLSTAAYARDLCSGEKRWDEAREVFERRASYFDFADEVLVAGVVEEMVGRCAEFGELVDPNVVRADLHAYEELGPWDVLLAGVSLTYEPGEMRRVEG